MISRRPARVVRLASPSAVLLLAVVLATGCADAPERPRLVLLYATCALNRDYLAPYAPEVSFTPNLARFASEGVVFERHQSESGQSGIAFASLFSGVQAYRHGVYYHPARLPQDLYLITEAFADAGYDPWFWGAHSMASWDLGYFQGVPDEHVTYAKPPRKRDQKLALLQPGDPRFAELLDRLEADPDYRAFVVVNFTITHDPYHIQVFDRDYDRFLERFPEEARGVTRADFARWWPLYERNRRPLQWNFPNHVEALGLSESDVRELARVLEVTYKADVWVLDRLFGRTLEVLRERGLLDRSLVAFTADHGETLYRDGTLFKWTHGLQLAPEVLSTPWIVRSGSQSFASDRYAAVTRSIDVFPTLAGLAGLELPPDAGPEGVDLTPALLGEAEAPDLLAFSHTSVIGPRFADEFKGWQLAGRFYADTDPNLVWARLRRGDRVYKLRNLDGERWGFEAFDLAADPEERRNLFRANDPDHAEMARRLEEYKQLLVRNYGRNRGEALSDSETLERLRAPGYIGQ